MGFLRSLISLSILIVLIVLGSTVKLGSRTFFGHVSRIWEAKETQELVEGVKETAAPVVDKVKRGAQAGWEATRDDGGTPAEPAPGEGDAVDELAAKAGEVVGDKAGDVVRETTEEEIKAKLSGK